MVKLGKLYRRGECDLSVIYHFKQFGDKAREADISLYLCLAFVALCGNLFHRCQPLPKLGRSQIGALTLALDGIKLHLVGEGFFGRKDMISVEIGIYHCNDSLLIGHIADGGRECQTY